MKPDDWNKILKQALFLVDKESFDASCAQPSGFRDLMLALLNVVHPDIKAWTEKGDERILFTDPAADDRIKANGFINTARIFQNVRPDDPEWNKEFLRTEGLAFIANAINEFRRQLAAVDFDKGVIANPNATLSKIVPLLKSDVMIHGMELSFVKQGLPNEERYRLLSWPVLDRVRVVPAFDTPDNFQFMHRFNADELGITPEEVHDHALANFRTTAKRIKIRSDYTKPIVVIDRIGGIASSLLLLPEFWEKEAVKAKDELVIHVAEYDTLLVARKSDRQAAARLIGMAYSGSVASVFSPPILFVFDRNGLRVLQKSDVI
ncbi:hypothetical protein HFO56_24490 [Rhizobium laguerreae]|uniref:hypothetical protein n=1 Tax=Rhizobium laguerreae TaxID=1076926 RepID=UPI001C91BDD1|nr:hypothetical protein [Rhizobium laguerreae]MBY3155490.1 hypothetical protein [Rhizobium laguerreae]